MTRHLPLIYCLLAFPSFGLLQADESELVRIASPNNGHIHPAICYSKRGTLIVIYGSKYHEELAVTRSSDGGRTWTPPVPFEHTVNKTHYPGSLTALRNGQILHAWNRWSGPNNQQEPRSVLYSLSSDEGGSWSIPKPLPSDPRLNSVIRHPIVEVSSRQWLFSLTDKTFVYDPVTESGQAFGAGRVQGCVPVVRTPPGTYISGQGLRSVDDGKSWGLMAGFPDYGMNVAAIADSPKGWLIPGSGYRNDLVCLSNGWLLASQILGPGRGGTSLRYVISRDDGVSWDDFFEFYNPGRPIGGRACPRAVQLDARMMGVVFFDISPDQSGGPGLFFLRIPLAKLGGQ